MNQRSVVTFIVLPCCAFLLVLVAAAIAHFGYGADFAVLDPKGPVALAERHIIFLTLALCSIVVVPTFFALFFFAWRYRENGPHAHDGHEPEWDHDSAGAEFFWWLVPTAIILALAFVAWDGSHALDPYKRLEGASGTPITIDVVALQWKWMFVYPGQGVASVNELEIPAGAPVTFRLTADAPMNSFWIPSLGGQIMAMPGMVTELNLLASATGTFEGLSANISGKGFADMNFKVHAVTQEDFDAWAATARMHAPPLDAPTYAALARPSIRSAPTTYVLADTTLFDDITARFMMPMTSSFPAKTAMMTP